MTALYSESVLALDPEVRRMAADLDAANQHRQALVLQLDAAESTIVELAAELLELRSENDRLRLEAGFAHAVPTVTGRSLPEVVEDLGRNLAAFPSVFEDAPTGETVVFDPDAPRVEVTRG